MNETEFMAYAEKICFSKPWTINDILAVTDSEYGVFVTLEDEQGYVGYALGRISFDEAELFRIAVLPEKRNKHFGNLLLFRFMEECERKHVRRIFLEVRSKNLPAVGMYKKAGFEQISVRKGYYGDDDALIFVYPAS